MKNIIILFLFLLPALAWGQFPANPSKIVQGRQTTAAGLVAVTNTSPPGWTPANWRHDAFMALDTVTARLWCWDGGEADWGECGGSGGGGGVDTMYLSGDSLFVESGAATFFVVLPSGGLTEAQVAAQIADSLAAYVPSITTDPSLSGTGTALSPLRVSPAPRTLNDTGPTSTIGQTEYDEYDLYLFSFNGTKALTISAATTVAAYRLELVNIGTGLLNVTGATAPTGFSASVLAGGSAIAYSATGATWRITGDLVRTSGGDGALTVGAGTATTALIQSSTAGSTPVTLTAGANMTITENTGTGTITLSSAAGGGSAESYFDIIGTGQSNMVNRDVSPGSWTSPVDTNVLAYQFDTNIFEVANPALNNISPENENDPDPRNNIAWQFAKKSRMFLPNETKARILVSAKGGTGSWLWTPATTGEPDASNEMLDSLINKLNRAPADFKAKVILWHQGESDAIFWIGARETYLTRIQAIYDTLTNHPKVEKNAVMILGSLYGPSALWPDFSVYNTEIEKAAWGTHNFGGRQIIAAIFEETTIDDVHYSNESIDRIGVHYTTAYAQHLKTEYWKEKEIRYFQDYRGSSITLDTSVTKTQSIDVQGSIAELSTKTAAGEFTGNTTGGKVIVEHSFATPYAVSVAPKNTRPLVLRVSEKTDTSFAVTAFTAMNQDSLFSGALDIDYIMSRYVVPPPPAALLLDSLPARAAYSLRQLRTASTLSIRVRRSSDSAELNIGFMENGHLDTVSLKTFVGANSATVVTWYDQSGNGHNATVNVTAPSIMTAGVISRTNGQPSMLFATSSMQATSFTSCPRPFTASVVHRFGNTNASERDIFDAIGVVNRVLLHSGTGVYAFSAGTNVNTTIATTLNRALVRVYFPATGNSTITVNTTTQTHNVGTLSGFSSGLLIGATGAFRYTGTMSEMIFWAGEVNAQGLINAYYNIY